MFLSDKGPTLETSDFIIRIGSVHQPYSISIYICINTAYMQHTTFISVFYRVYVINTRAASLLNGFKNEVVDNYRNKDSIMVKEGMYTNLSGAILIPLKLILDQRYNQSSNDTHNM